MTVFHPRGKFKIRWDLMIIFLTLLNCLQVPYEIAYGTSTNIYVIVIERLIDVVFIIDIAINFRTMYLSSKTLKLVKNTK